MAAKSPEIKICEALDILESLKLPAAQQNERSALSLLALCDMTRDKAWSEARAPLLGISQMMGWFRNFYNKIYAPNTRETVRRQTIHQFVAAGIALYNPDDPGRPVNSPAAVYQISPEALVLLKSYGTVRWTENLELFLLAQGSLSDKYAMKRNIKKIPLIVRDGGVIQLSPGKHSSLIKNIVEEFAPRFAPGSELIYIGDTGDKWGYVNEDILNGLGMRAGWHGKMPDVMLYDRLRNWVFLIESVTSHGPMDNKRVYELKDLFYDTKPIFVSAFPDRSTMRNFLASVAWETEVWIADSPEHLIHFNGSKFLGPYDDNK